MLQRLDSVYFKVSFIKQGTEETIELLESMSLSATLEGNEEDLKEDILKFLRSEQLEDGHYTVMVKLTLFYHRQENEEASVLEYFELLDYMVEVKMLFN